MEPVTRILTVLDRHVTGRCELRLLGGAALILGYGLRRATEDVDLLIDDAEAMFLAEHRQLGAALEATNTELEPEGLYLTHIWGPEQQILTPRWREDCRPIETPGLSRLHVSVLGPLDLILSKLCRADDRDLDDIRHVLSVERLSPVEVRRALDTAVVPTDFSAVWPRHRSRLERLLG